MSESGKDKNKIPSLSVDSFLDAIADRYAGYNGNKGDFCFILGSGASKEAGVPMGTDLVDEWLGYLQQLSPNLLQERLKELKISDELQKLLEKLSISSEKLDIENQKKSKYYFDFFKLRFFGKLDTIGDYLKEKMKDAHPSIGHYALRSFLCYTDNHFPFVITTNFDVMVEEALADCGVAFPLVIPHEDMVKHIKTNADEPTILKVHRDLRYQPLNATEDMTKLKKGWKDKLSDVLQNYIPIVIGYAGADNTLMALLESLAKKGQLKTIYWVDPSKPDERVQKLLKKGHGFWIEKGFDDIMFRLFDDFKTKKLFSDGWESAADAMARISEKKQQTIKDAYEKYTKKIAYMGTIYTSKKEREERAKSIEALLRNLPKPLVGSAYEYNLRGGLEDVQGNYEKAIALFEQAIAYDLRFQAAYNNRGNTLVSLGKYEEAIDSCDKAIALDSNSSDAYFIRGLALRNWARKLYGKYPAKNNANKAKKLYEEALTNYDKAIALYPDAVAYNNRGNVLADLGRHKEAIASYNKAIELDPDYALSYQSLGSVLYELGCYEEALDNEDKAIKLDPNIAGAYNSRGTALVSLKRNEEALASFDKAIALDPNLALAYNNRGNALKDMGRYEEALESVDKAIELNPNLILAIILRQEILDAINKPKK